MQALGLIVVLAASGCHALRVAPLRPPPRAVRATSPVLVASQLEESIQETTASNAVVIYSKSWCPFCAKTKALFDELEQPYTAIELDQRDDGAELQETLLGITGQRTVPNVFVAGQHMGGNDDTQAAAKSGKLAELLNTEAATTGRVVPTTGAASSSEATAAQLKAVAENKMITETEATIRKVAGVGMGLLTAFQYASGGMAYTTLSAGVFGALSVYRSGAAYQ